MAKKAKKPEITSRQRQVLELVLSFSREHGYPPTRKQIAEHFGFASPNAADCHVKRLVDKGFLFHEKNSARGIRVVRIPA